MCNVFFCTARIDAALILGRFILCCSHCIRRAEDPRFESEPRRQVSLLPESNRSDAQSNITTTRLGGRPDLDQS